MSYLGLDIGTGACKAVVFDESGRQIASASREYTVSHPQAGWAELDPFEVGNHCLSAIREAAGQSGYDPVRGLGISSQGEAFTVLDRNGEILSPAMVSSDNRAAALVGPWTEEFGAERLYKKTGHTAHPIFTIFKLLWLRQNLPEIWRRASKILCFEDYLHVRLGLDPGISWSLAGRTLLFNVVANRWDSEILESLGLVEAQLARPLAPGAPVGMIPDSVADNLGLARNAMVVAGGHDQVCAALGSGAISPGLAALSTGSVECVTVMFPEATRSEVLRRANLCTYSHAIPGKFATLAYNLTGGNLVRWFRDQLGRKERADATGLGRDAYDLIFEQLPDGPSSLLVLPYFTASGTPHFDGVTPGAIVGLRLDTTREMILRGLLEGLAFELRVNLELLSRAGITVDKILAVGGGTKSRAWLQLKADVLGRIIEVPEVTETGCLGGAILSCAAVQGKNPADLAVQLIRPGWVIEPREDLSARYSERVVAYSRAYEHLKKMAAETFPLS